MSGKVPGRTADPYQFPVDFFCNADIYRVLFVYPCGFAYFSAGVLTLLLIPVIAGVSMSLSVWRGYRKYERYRKNFTSENCRNCGTPSGTRQRSAPVLLQSPELP